MPALPGPVLRRRRHHREPVVDSDRRHTVPALEPEFEPRRAVGGHRRLWELPRKDGLDGAALGGPWLLYFEGMLRTVADLLVPLALSCGLYALALWLAGSGDGDCGRASPAGR